MGCLFLHRSKNSKAAATRINHIVAPKTRSNMFFFRIADPGSAGASHVAGSPDHRCCERSAKARATKANANAAAQPDNCHLRLRMPFQVNGAIFLTGAMSRLR